MGAVIRPAAFRRDGVPIHLGLAHRRRCDRQSLLSNLARFLNTHVVAVTVAVMALAWILALAGTVFAVRMVLLLGFATLAGRARRVGMPVRIVNRRANKRR